MKILKTDPIPKFFVTQALIEKVSFFLTSHLFACQLILINMEALSEITICFQSTYVCKNPNIHIYFVFQATLFKMASKLSGDKRILDLTD